MNNSPFDGGIPVVHGGQSTTVATGLLPLLPLLALAGIGAGGGYVGSRIADRIKSRQSPELGASTSSYSHGTPVPKTRIIRIMAPAVRTPATRPPVTGLPPIAPSLGQRYLQNPTVPPQIAAAIRARAANLPAPTAVVPWAAHRAGLFGGAMSGQVQTNPMMSSGSGLEQAQSVEDALRLIQEAALNDFTTGETAASKVKHGDVHAATGAVEMLSNPNVSSATLAGMARGLGVSDESEIAAAIARTLMAASDDTGADELVSEVMNAIGPNNLREGHGGIDLNATKQAALNAIDQTQLARMIKEFDNVLSNAGSVSTSALLSALSKVPVLGKAISAIRSARFLSDAGGHSLQVAGAPFEPEWWDQIPSVGINHLSSPEASALQSMYNLGRTGGGRRRGLTYPRRSQVIHTTEAFQKGANQQDRVVLTPLDSPWPLDYQDAATGLITIPRGASIPFLYDGAASVPGRRVMGEVLAPFTQAAGTNYSSTLYVLIPCSGIQLNSGREAVAALSRKLYARFGHGGIAAGATAPGVGVSYDGLTNVPGAQGSIFAEGYVTAQELANVRQAFSPVVGAANKAFHVLPDPFWLSVGGVKCVGSESYVILALTPFAIAAGAPFAVTLDTPIVAIHFLDPDYAATYFEGEGGGTVREINDLSWNSTAIHAVRQAVAEGAMASRSNMVEFGDMDRPNLASLLDGLRSTSL